MKICISLLALVGLAISFGMPTFAQEQKAVDPEVRQQIEAVMMKFAEAHNKHDAAAIAALYAQDAVMLWSWWGYATALDQQAIEQQYESAFASKTDFVGKLIQVYAIGDEMSAHLEWSAGPWKGHAIFIYVRAADTWKIRMEYANLTKPR